MPQILPVRSRHHEILHRKSTDSRIVRHSGKKNPRYTPILYTPGHYLPISAPKNPKSLSPWAIMHLQSSADGAKSRGHPRRKQIRRLKQAAPRWGLDRREPIYRFQPNGTLSPRENPAPPDMERVGDEFEVDQVVPLSLMPLHRECLDGNVCLFSQFRGSAHRNAATKQFGVEIPVFIRAKERVFPCVGFRAEGALHNDRHYAIELET